MENDEELLRAMLDDYGRRAGAAERALSDLRAQIGALAVEHDRIVADAELGMQAHAEADNGVGLIGEQQRKYAAWATAQRLRALLDPAPDEPPEPDMSDGWKVMQTAPGTFHCVPVSDIADHTEDWNCECQPEVRPTRRGWVITHVSYDGREDRE